MQAEVVAERARVLHSNVQEPATIEQSRHLLINDENLMADVLLLKLAPQLRNQLSKVFVPITKWNNDGQPPSELECQRLRNAEGKQSRPH